MSALARARAVSAALVARSRSASPLRLALLGALALGTATTGVVAAVPVATAGFATGPTVATGGAALVSLPGYGARGMDVLDYQDRAEVELRVPLSNTGRFAVRVSDVDLGGGRLELLEVVEGPAAFSLAPGESRVVALRARLANCRYYHEREVRTYDGVRVRFQTAVGGGTREVPLVRPITVHSPMIIGCADRKLDRSADNRTPGSTAG